MADSLGSVVLGVEVALDAFQAGLNRAQSLAQSAGQQIQKGIGGGTGPSLTSLTIKLNSLQDELQQVAIGTRRFRELRAEIEKTQKTINSAAGGGGSLLGGLVSGLAGLGAGAAAVGFLKSSIQAAVELESITKKLSNTLGEQGAGRALAFTRGLADQLGLSFKTLAGTFGGFTAAATAANVPIDQQQALFAAVAKAAQSLGLSNDELQGSLLALQQVASKGTVSMEELRGQLGERLPIAFAAAAKGLGKTQQELIKLVESGQLTSSQFFPALTKGLNELTANAGGTETAAQNFQKLSNAWDELQTSFGTTLLPGITKQVKDLAGALDGLKVGREANQLGLGGLFGNLGLVPDQAVDAVVAVRQVRDEFNLTDQQARALFTDAAKLSGLRQSNTGYLPDANGLTAALAKLPALAEQFRAKNQDATAELKRQQAEAAKLLEQDKQRVISSQKLLDSKLLQNRSQLDLQGTQDRIDAARQLVTLEGTSLVSLQNKLAVEESLRNAKKAQLELERELAKPAGDGKDGTRSSARVDELLAKQRQANLDVTRAYADAGAALVQNAKTAAAALKDAQQSLQSVLRGGFDLLTPGLQQEQIARARASIQPLVDRGVIRTGVDISSPDKLFQVAQFAESFSRAEQDLGKALIENTAAQKALAEKNWQVNVAVPGGSASGDVVSAVNSQL